MALAWAQDFRLQDASRLVRSCFLHDSEMHSVCAIPALQWHLWTCPAAVACPILATHTLHINRFTSDNTSAKSLQWGKWLKMIIMCRCP